MGVDRIAIIGANGQLGRELCRQLGARACPFARPALDVTQSSQVWRVLSELRPDAIVNCTAYTQVDKAETDLETCMRVNVDAVGHLADAAAALNCPLVHISTDYVFGADRNRKTPYCESDAPAPQGAYARSKAAGERRAADWEKHLIIRTCGLFGPSPHRNNFVETMLRLAERRDHLRVVDDQHCNPTFVNYLARAVLYLLESDAHGIFHIVSKGETTWYRFAREIFRLAEVEVSVEPITSEQFGAIAPRPHYSVLDTSKYLALGGPGLPPWQDGLAEYLALRN